MLNFPGSERRMEIHANFCMLIRRPVCFSCQAGCLESAWRGRAKKSLLDAFTLLLFLRPSCIFWEALVCYFILQNLMHAALLVLTLAGFWIWNRYTLKVVPWSMETNLNERERKAFDNQLTRTAAISKKFRIGKWIFQKLVRIFVFSFYRLCSSIAWMCSSIVETCQESSIISIEESLRLDKLIGQPSSSSSCVAFLCVGHCNYDSAN